MKLKTIIANHELNRVKFDHFVPLEIQLIENINAQEVVQQEVAVETNVLLEEIHYYDGELVNYHSFKEKTHFSTEIYDLLNHELFANLPHAIKFVSPDAMLKLAENIQGLITLNKDNLPHGFILKHTHQNELVLDYDAFLDNAQANVFTPNLSSHGTLEPLDSIQFSDEDIQRWIDADKHPFLANFIRTNATRLINVFMKHGDQGVIEFLNPFIQSSAQPELMEFFCHHYLAHFPQWDHLNQANFFTGIERISHYEEHKKTCLFKFLENTGTSRHDLSKTLEAFERFWNEVSVLCHEKNVPITEIIKDWTTPKGGNPIVYMERLLVILKNARDLNAQFKSLRKLSLGNYEAYYASRYEGFTTVSAPEMGLLYDPEKQNKQLFHSNLSLHAIDFDAISELYEKRKIYQHVIYKAKEMGDFVARILSRDPDLFKQGGKLPYPPYPEFWLIDSTFKPSNEYNFQELIENNKIIPFNLDDFKPPFHLYERDIFSEGQEFNLLYENPRDDLSILSCVQSIFRFIGMQPNGILVTTLNEAIEKRRVKNWVDKPAYIDNYLLTQLYCALFFVSHERYIEEDEDLIDDLLTFSGTVIHNEAKIEKGLFNTLRDLYKLNSKLNISEALTFFGPIGGLNAFENAYLNVDQGKYIADLLQYLQQNKHGTFKYLVFRIAKGHCKWPYIYALDTAKFLATDPLIDITYRDDLLFFSGLINSVNSEVYFDSPQCAAKMPEMVKKVQYFLHQAASLPQPNNLQYAVHVLINSMNYFSFTNFINACEQIEKIPSFDSNQVGAVLRQNNLQVTGNQLPLIFKDKQEIKAIMIQLIIRLDALVLSTNANHQTTSIADLHKFDVTALQQKVNELWTDAGALLEVTDKIFLAKILEDIKGFFITEAFGELSEGLFSEMAGYVGQLPSFKNGNDFVKANKIGQEIDSLAKLFKQIWNNPYVKTQEKVLSAALKKVNFSNVNYETLYVIGCLLADMGQQDYTALLTSLLTNQKFINDEEVAIKLVNDLAILNTHYLPLEFLEGYSRLILEEPNKNNEWLRELLITQYKKDPLDPILNLILKKTTYDYEQAAALITLSQHVELNRNELSHLFSHWTETKILNELIEKLKACDNLPQKQSIQLITILSRAHASIKKEDVQVDFVKLTDLLKNLSEEKLSKLTEFYKTSPISASCLFNALQNSDNTHFDDFLLALEKAPFGQRDLALQFSCVEVERIVNESHDLINNSPYPYQYRKQMMEAFLFVNEIGNDLPVYNNKSAKELSNNEIAQFFQVLKSNPKPDLTSFQQNLLALGLIREAMYRSTGQFPYSTQMIALIDRLMHPGDLISNIDTGQGKSLIDVMGASLLWLHSTRVDVMTSSLIDAKRDIEHYGAFLKLLNIPYSEAPINALSSPSVFQKNGINFSTFAQMSLFFAKATVEGEALETPKAKVSLIANESDYLILADRMTYRFATSDSSGLSYGQEWVYYAINEFVTAPGFLHNNLATAEEDISHLKAYLEVRAGSPGKAKLIGKFSDEQYLTWLESALIVNFVLKENQHYVIPDEYEKKKINGQEKRSRVIKVLMHDKKVSPDSSFGNGITELLYASLNKKLGTDDFIIQPQNKTIISVNNKNRIDYYRRKNGYIWGSSGTVGSEAEILEQRKKYGFDFTKIASHQKKNVQFNEPVFLDDETAQFAVLIKQLTLENLSNSTAPSLVFCKDIETAQRLFQALERNNPNKFPIQCFLGLGKEETFISEAAKPGMITITTSALGRNTDIPYNKESGLNVWHTYIDSLRGTDQKSGRTGRQGSGGTINFIFNKQEMGSKTIEDIRQDIDQLAGLERAVNEELYDILDGLLTYINELPEVNTEEKKQRLRKEWSNFSTTTEATYRAIRFDDSYEHDNFMYQTLASFNNELKLHLELDELKALMVSNKHPQKATYDVSNKPVTLNECTLPFTIAYHLLNNDPQEAINTNNIKQQINNRLTQLFENLPNKKFNAVNTDYIKYLMATNVEQKIIVEAHREFISDFIRKNSKKRNIVLRWLGFERKLNKIASNKNYLLMFHALTSTPHQNNPIVELDLIKQSINALLDSYLESSWFINTQRKQWANALKKQINEAENPQMLVTLLSKHQADMAEQDIKTNENRHKPLHIFGSRYQKTLNRALSLTVSLNDRVEIDPTPLNDALTNASGAKTSSQLTFDNTAVIRSCLKNTNAIQGRQTPIGMQGRHTLFSLPEKIEVINDDVLRESQIP